MPPEQIRGKIRDSGPWTDLYSIGVLGWVLASGHTPSDTMICTSSSECICVPIFPTFFRVFRSPTGLKAGFRQCCKRHWWSLPPRCRCRLGPRASHRNRGHLRLPTRLSPLASYAYTPIRRLPDIDHQRRVHAHRDRRLQRHRSGSPSGALSCPSGDALPQLLGPERASAAKQLLAGAGLGVYSLRSPPLVGRFDGQDATWEVLRSVVAGEGCQMVLFEADSGLGVIASDAELLSGHTSWARPRCSARSTAQSWPWTHCGA